MSSKVRLCFEFQKNGSCRFGDKCKFTHSSHQKNGARGQRSDHPGNASNKSQRAASTSETALGIWYRKLPRNKGAAQPLGSELGEFFQEALRLVNIDDGLMQSVVMKLAGEGGLTRIKELLERDFEKLSAAAGLRVLKLQMQPFFAIITKRNVTESLILESEVARLYNFICGVNGARAIPLFVFLSKVLDQMDKHDNEFIAILEQTAVVFCKVLDTNTQALVQPSLAESAKRIEATFISSLDTHDRHALSICERHLERLLHRLNIGISIPAMPSSTGKSQKKPPTAFAVKSTPPGGRHDNDFADICNIQILPTTAEINSQRSEYLPDKDPTHWHVGGVGGLLDRNFRLLREDSVGQLRDAIQRTLQDQVSKPKSKDVKTKEGLRTYSYPGAAVIGLNIDRHVGFYFELQFPQPERARKLSAKDRSEWWERSKRFQSDALVCIIDSDKSILFCTVSSARRDNQRKDAPATSLQLDKDGRFASICLSLVEHDEASVQCTLKWCSDQSKDQANKSLITIVEFPGVLLPAFYPTLQAIQKMKKSGDLPFAQYLAPSDVSGFVNIPPPAYTRKPGFAFNLQSVMTGGENLNLRPEQPFELDKLAKSSSLDRAQADSLVSALSHSLSLVQGPPGTGKSYTGVAALKVLLANKAALGSKNGIGPIICICYTNHALDNLLEDVLDSGMTTQIIRLGSRSRSERLQDHNLRVVAKKVEKTKQEKFELWKSHESKEKLEAGFAPLAAQFRNASSAANIKRFLRDNYIHDFNDLFGKDEDGFHKVGADNPEALLRAWLHAKPSISADGQTRLGGKSLHGLSKNERYSRYHSWIRRIKQRAEAEIEAAISSLKTAQDQHRRVLNEHDLRCLRQADIIGVTTSGLARNIEVFRRIDSKILVVEEAGEVLEAHLLAALIPSLEHLILIGDHLQLRPQVNFYELSRESRAGVKYSLDVSLFERLVQPNVEGAIQLPYSTLEIQRRMHPSISQLVRDTLYPALKDYPDVAGYPEVSGMRKRLFWLDHQESESNTTDGGAATSYFNEHEINIVSALVTHLLQQGTYASGEIAVITPYLGQYHRLKRKLQTFSTITVDERDEIGLEQAGLVEDEPQPAVPAPAVRKSSLWQALRVATIDNFQGEEAKIVIVSLVRSNKQRKCGFLKTSNRINVLLSRAKHGMYILGNAATSAPVQMWSDVIDILRVGNNFGTELELHCPRHPKKEMKVSKSDDFTIMAPEGGCNERCIQRLGCGHACLKKCHSDLLHKAVHCLEVCTRSLKKCDHPCPKVCGDPCPTDCKVIVRDPARVLPCGHLKPTLPCWETHDLNLIRCQEMVKKTVAGCKHQIEIRCHKDVSATDFSCPVECGTILPCGHTCRKRCSWCKSHSDEQSKFVFDHGDCAQPCGRLFKTCAHSCRTPCHGSEGCPACQAPCENRCYHSQCAKICSEPCVPCAEETCLSSCPHSSCSLPCSAPCNHIPCSRRCDKYLSCGHRCPGICGDACPDQSFCQVCADEDVKEKMVDFLEGKQYKDVDVDENPCIFPSCGHFLTIESMDGSMSLSDHYEMSPETGFPVALKSTSQPFSMDDIKTCPTCRGSLRNLSRYGRLVRRAILDESTKKLILWINQELVPLASQLQSQLELLKKFETKEPSNLHVPKDNVSVDGLRNPQVFRFGQTLSEYDKKAWGAVRAFRTRLIDYLNQVRVSEQPFNRVRDAVQAVRRRTGRNTEFTFDESVLQTKGYLLATGLLLRLDIAILMAFLSLKRPAGYTMPKFASEPWLTDIEGLLTLARQSKRVPQQVEALTYRAQIYAIQCSRGETDEATESIRKKGHLCLLSAKRLCASNPGQTRGMLEEIDLVATMLRESTFYAPVSSDERLSVLKAMATEFRGSGHWYVCTNGHPFTIGECGMPMERATCPECSAPVGGQNHQTVEGVTHARGLEEELRGLRI